MTSRTSYRRWLARSSVAAVCAITLAHPGVASAETTESHALSRGNPFHLVGHLLAPVGQAFGFLIVEPMFWVFDNVPKVFELD